MKRFLRPWLLNWKSHYEIEYVGFGGGNEWLE